MKISGEKVEFLAEHELPKEFEEIASTDKKDVKDVTRTSVNVKGNEESIKTLMELGADRAQAIEALNACDGNPDLAANLLFQI